MPVREPALRLSQVQERHAQPDELAVHHFVGVPRAASEQDIPVTSWSGRRHRGGRHLAERRLEEGLLPVNEGDPRGVVALHGLAKQHSPQRPARQPERQPFLTPSLKCFAEHGLDVTILDAPVPPGLAERIELGPGASAQQCRTPWHRLLERQVLQGVQRVVMDEHPNGPLVRQEAMRGGQRRVEHVTGAAGRRGGAHQCPPPATALLMSMPSTRMAMFRRGASCRNVAIASFASKSTYSPSA